MTYQSFRAAISSRYRRLAPVVLVACLAFAACTQQPALDQAVQCKQFQRLPNGNWMAATEVALTYNENGTNFQDHFDKGSVLTAKDGGRQALIVAALDRKCAANQ